jgi:RNA polymerase sigma factor (sigma-70 family)
VEQQTIKLVDHLFRHEAGKMTAILTKIFGLHQLQLVEDVVQEAFLKAVQTWPFQGIPDNPSAWLMRVAKNKALDLLNRTNYWNRYLQNQTQKISGEAYTLIDHFFLDTEVSDSQLQMMFACCHPALSSEDQIALTLKTVSGFGVNEIAKALVTNGAVVQKRLYRAKHFIKEQQIEMAIPTGGELVKRLDVVHTIIYLLFNEGYNSTKADELIRKDLCAEAMRLCRLLCEHPLLQQSSSSALLALMCFHASRFDSRLDEQNSIILLQDQDRSKWSQELIALGYQYLHQSAKGDQLSVYHIESAIAAEHCFSPSVEKTNWMRLLQLYDLLVEYKPNPTVHLNRAVVLAHIGYIDNAIQSILQISDIQKLLITQYIFPAVLGDLYSKAGNNEKARELLEQAMVLTPSLAEKQLLLLKLEAASK